MPKHGKNPHKHKVEVSPRLSFHAQVKMLRASNDELKRQAGKMRRLLWVAVHQAGGRVEMDESDYRMAMDMPAEDSIVSVQHDKENKKIILVFTDEKGNKLKESDPPLIILTDPK